MSKTIVINVQCYACHHREAHIHVKRPTPLQKTSFMRDCELCASRNTYRISARGDKVTIETLRCQYTERGLKEHEKRTGENLIKPLEQQSEHQP